MTMYHKDGTLPPDDSYIFVFGSNEGGRHGAGAAEVAKRIYGRENGTGFGLINSSKGSTWAIPTKDGLFRTLPLTAVGINIRQFCNYAISNPSKKFFLTRVGCGLAGFSDEDIAHVFNLYMPTLSLNVSFPDTWKPFLEHEENYD